MRRAVTFPLDPADQTLLDAAGKAAARDEAFIIEEPAIAEGATLLSYAGGKDQIADLWLDNAQLAPNSQRLLFPGQPPAAPTSIRFTTGDTPAPARYNDTCRTTVIVRRAKGSPPIAKLKLYQTDSADDPHFRQIVLDAGDTPLQIEFHTDSPPSGATNLPGCDKRLTVGSFNTVKLPEILVLVTVLSGKVDLRLNPETQSSEVFSKDDLFQAVSIGSDIAENGGLKTSGLQAGGLQVVSTVSAKARLALDMQPVPSGRTIFLSHLQIGSSLLKLDIGQTAQKAYIYANGVSLYSLDIVALAQKNIVISLLIGAFVTPWLVAWIKKTCFPKPSRRSRSVKPPKPPP